MLMLLVVYVFTDKQLASAQMFIAEWLDVVDTKVILLLRLPYLARMIILPFLATLAF